MLQYEYSFGLQTSKGADNNALYDEKVSLVRVNPVLAIGSIRAEV
jgi:hypothetical protein